MNCTALPDIGIGIKCLTAISHSPFLRRLAVESRKKYSFLSVIEGEFHYKTTKGEFFAKAGDSVFLPKGASYEYRIISEKTRCHQVEFQLFGDLPTMPERPILMPSFASRAIAEDFPKLIAAFLSPADDFTVYALISRFLCFITSERRIDPKIKAATEYLEKNFCEPFSTERLARLCALSPSQLRRIFHKSIGMPPIQYRNRLRINYACLLLDEGEMTIAEIAEALNFDTLCAFSKAFKAETGSSPKQYQRRNTVDP